MASRIGVSLGLVYPVIFMLIDIPSDCTGRNIMIDMRSLLPGKQWHPHTPVMSSDMRSSIRPLPRCQATPPARYFFIGFGMASRDTNAVTGTLCRDFTVPELSDTVPYDPFKVDVYTLGNYFLRDFVEVS